MNPLFPGAGPSGRSSAAGGAQTPGAQPDSPSRCVESSSVMLHCVTVSTCHNHKHRTNCCKKLQPSCMYLDHCELDILDATTIGDLCNSVLLNLLALLSSFTQRTSVIL